MDESVSFISILYRTEIEKVKLDSRLTKSFI